MDRMVNKIQLTWMLRTYRTCNSTVEFSKYEFYNKLLSSVTLFIITPDVTWTQPYIYIYIYIYILQQKELLYTSYRKMYSYDIVINDIQITNMGWDLNVHGILIMKVMN